MEQQEKALKSKSFILMGIMFLGMALFFTYISYFDLLHENFNKIPVQRKQGDVRLCEK